MAATTITAERIGRRTYLRGDTYPVRDRLRQAGARWDPDQRAWWLSDHEAAERLVGELLATSTSWASAAAVLPPGDEAIVAARAEYRGRPCYVAGRVVRGRTHWDDGVAVVVSRDGERLLLYSLDGARQWWAPAAEVAVRKRYQRPQTIGALRRFREEAARNGGIHPDACPQCGSLSCSAARGRGGLCDED